MVNSIKIISFICAIMAGSSSYAAQGSGISAADFLNIGISARSAATGGVFSAISDGPISSYYNPAGLALTENYQIAGMHSEWFQDLRYEYFGFSMPVGKAGGVGLSFSYLGLGSIEGYSESDVPTGTLSAYDMALMVSYGHRITPGLSVGLGVKAIEEKLDNVNANGFAGDFGVQYRSGRYHMGLSLMNIGPKIKYETSSWPLPTTVNTGISYYPFGGGLSVMAGAAFPLRGEFSLKAGIEYSYQGLLMLRGGYDSKNNFDGEGGISLGGGLALSNHSIDYAYNINAIMGSTHQISFTLRFGRVRQAAIYDDSYERRSARQYDFIGPAERTIDDSNVKYQVCVARYNDETSAQKHIDTLGKLGLKARLAFDGKGEYRVVLKEVEGKSKAEKVIMKFEKKGISCFLQEM